MTAVTYFELIEKARTARDLFPESDAARGRYRRLAKLVHPDVNDNDPRAESAFARLQKLWNEFSNGGLSASSAVAYQTKRHTYEVGNLLARGDISNVYAATYDAGHERVVIKMPRSPVNSDLIVNEITTLKTLSSEVPENLKMFHPTMVDSFRHRDVASGKDRRAVVLQELEGFYTLAQVIAAYPQGIEGRDLAWIARRLFVALAAAHDVDIAHGAVTPENVMIHPTMHGVVLIDWVHAKPFGETLTSISSPYRLDYGTKIAKPLDHRLDVQMSSHTLESLLGRRPAKPFRAFFKGCRVSSAPPAGQLFQEFDELLTRLYGKRKYHPFTMPVRGQD